MLTAPELDSKNVGSGVIDGQISLGEDEFYQKYENKIKLLTDKFMPIKDEDGSHREQRLKEMEQYADYRNYLSFSMYEQVTDAQGNVIRENFVDEMAGRDSGGEGQNPKYVALLAGLQCFICSRVTGIPRLNWCCWMKPFPRWIRREVPSACSMRARWIYS